MKAEDLYVGEAGSRYYAMRAGRRSDAVQKTRTVLFADVIPPGATVLDFGCGTGGVLSALEAKRRIGVEISEAAAAEAAQRLDEIHKSLGEIPDASVDVAISCHALEHVDEPANVIRELHRVLRPGGVLRIAVPCEMPLLVAAQRKWRADDKDMHLFAWTPLTLGNLVRVNGFENIEAEMLPDSSGGRLGALFAPGAAGRRLFSRLSAPGAFIRG